MHGVQLVSKPFLSVEIILLLGGDSSVLECPPLKCKVGCSIQVPLRESP